MQLNNLKPAWKQIKLLNGMQPIESEVILSMIEESGSLDKPKLQIVFFNVVMFIVITIFCQGG